MNISSMNVRPIKTGKNQRDPRAAQLLSARFRVQAWYTFGKNEWPMDIAFINRDLIQTTVEQNESSKPRTALLIEFNSNAQTLEDDWLPEKEKLRNITSRLRFCWMGLPLLICARLVDTTIQPDNIVRAKTCHPSKVGGIATFRSQSVGYGLHDSSLLVRPCREETDQGIRWYLAALQASDAFTEAVCLWTAVESLAPRLHKSPVCGHCSSELPACPNCEKVFETPAVMQSIAAYLLDALGLAKKTVASLYKFRSKIVHGERDRDTSTHHEAIDHVAELRPLVEKLLFRELGIPQHRPFFDQYPDHAHDALYTLTVRIPWHEQVFELPAPLYSEFAVVDLGDLPEDPPDTPRLSR